MVGGLFGKKNPNDTAWMFMSNQITAGTVYMIPKDFMAAELIVSENARIIDYPMQPGENYYFEISEWVTAEYHEPDAFVEIATG